MTQKLSINLLYDLSARIKGYMKSGGSPKRSTNAKYRIDRIKYLLDSFCQFHRKKEIISGKRKTVILTKINLSAMSLVRKNVFPHFNDWVCICNYNRGLLIA